MSQSLPAGTCCRACGYPLAGIPEPRCPECGRAFDPGDPRTFDRSVRARRWRRRRPLAIAALALLLVYATFPRGYVRGTLVYAPGGGEAQERITIWRLAPPRWLARVPYPRWTSREAGGQYLLNPTAGELAGEVRTYLINLNRCRWFKPPFPSGRVSSTMPISASASPEPNTIVNITYARALLKALVRRQCWGLGGIVGSPDDSAIPAALRDAREPW